MDMIPLTSLDNPKVKAMVKLRDHSQRRAEGLFIAQGQREMARAIQAGLTLVAWYDCPAIRHTRSTPSTLPWQPDEQARRHARGYEVPEALMLKMAYKAKPEGILGVFEQPIWTWEDLETRQIRAKQADHAPALYLVAVGVNKPGNLGAMARSAVAAGAGALLVADGVVDAWNPNAIRASTGAVFTLPILGDTSERIRDYLTRHDIHMYTASPASTLSYTQTDLTGPSALVIGAEDTGLDDAWLSAGAGLTIRMETAAVDSLNASVAAGVLLFEARRQREARQQKSTSPINSRVLDTF